MVFFVFVFCLSFIVLVWSFLYRILALTKKALKGPYIGVGDKVGWEDQTKDQRCLFFFFKIFLNFLNVHWLFAHMCGCVKVSELLELELQTVVSSPVGTGNETWVLCKSNQYSNS